MTAAMDLIDIVKDFSSTGSFVGSLLGRTVPSIRAVDHVTLSVNQGEIVGVIGQSGSGKSTLGRIAVRLTQPTTGEVRFEGLNISGLSSRPLRRARRGFQMIFQDPYQSLNPRKTIGWLIEEPLRLHDQAMRDAERQSTVLETLERVGLLPAREFYARYPAQLSGGQRQRAAIARAVVVRPRFLVADEPVSMLDVSVRAGILALLRDLTEEWGMAQLFITHDLAVAKQLCDRLAVMRRGQIIESGPAGSVLSTPEHDYTKNLINALPALPK